jgi:DNA-3-methyladenine glycosylase II
VLVLDGEPVEIGVTQEGGTEAPVLHVAFEGLRSTANESKRGEVRAALEKMLSLGLDIDPFYALAGADPMLASLAGRFRGVRPPRFASVFECLVNAVALQQLSLDAGLTLVNRLAHAYGASAPTAGSRMCAFPAHAELAAARP